VRVRPYGVGTWKLRVFFRHWDPDGSRTPGLLT
jgi:hypothetical protein